MHDEVQATGGALAERLRERIRQGGPLRFRDWMEAALYDAREGYYCRSDRVRWGRSGDYRTAPERSELFAITLAAYFAEVFDALGAPQAFAVLESGAGDGTFAHGVLSALRRQRPDVYARARYFCAEASSDARRRIAVRLAPFAERTAILTANETPPPIDAGVIFSNELLDAFPVHRVRMGGGGLREMYVGLGPDDQFVWVEGDLSDPRLADYFARHDANLAEGHAAEVNLAAREWVARAAAILRRGYLVTIDYGASATELWQDARRRDGTLRAFAAHQLPDDTLNRPGEQDLTTTINWTDLIAAGDEVGWRTIALRRLDEFLLAHGLLRRLEELSAGAEDAAQVAAWRLGARELALPGGMGASFQVLVQQRAE